MIIMLVLITLMVGIIMFMMPRITGDITKEEINGTFSKAEKYIKQQSTEKDIQLRTELASDTARLLKMIAYVLTIERYNTTVSNQIDTILSRLRDHPIMTSTKYNSPLLSLKDFRSWLIISNNRLDTLRNLLEQLYSNNVRFDQSTDVEKEIRAFFGFIRQLSVRDTVLEYAAGSIDMYIGETVKNRLPEGSSHDLKSIRDQLLADYLLTASLVGDNKNFKKLSRTIESSCSKEYVSSIAKLVNQTLFRIEPEAFRGYLGRIEPQAFGGELFRIEPQAFGGELFRIEP